MTAISIQNEKKVIDLSIDFVDSEKLNIDEVVIRDKFLGKELSLLSSLIDLTSLSGTDTINNIQGLCQSASENSVAAVCVFPRFIKTCLKSLSDKELKVACVATGFPTGQIPLSLKKEEVLWCINEGVQEIDIVLNRGLFLEKNYQEAFNEIKTICDLCHASKVDVKVILEIDELKTASNIALASLISMYAGADFIKTSTGKVGVGATLEACFVMANSIKNFHKITNKKVGLKLSGGIKTVKNAYQYIDLIKKVLGDDWIDSTKLRIGASSLLKDIKNYR